MRHLYHIGALAGLTFGNFDQVIPVPPNVECPVGYNLLGKICEQKVIEPALITCALGQLQGSKCVTYADTVQTCPIGSEQENNECKIYQYEAPCNECPSGYVLEGNSCIQKIPLPIQEICDVGKPDGKGGCFVTERVSKIIKKTCPAGYQDEGSGCAKTTTYDCSPDEVTFPKPVFLTPTIVNREVAIPQTVHTPIPQPLPMFSASKKGGHRMLGGKRGSYAPLTIAPVMPSPVPVQVEVPIQTAPLPLVVRTQPVAPIPPSNVAVVKQLCQRQDYAPYVTDTFCPQGYAEDGDSCVVTATYPMSQQCINGNSISSCYEPKIAPIQKHCKLGTLIGDRCVIARTLPLENVCPAGTERIGNTCQQFTTPTFTCSPGHVLEGTNCVGVMTLEPVGLITKTCQSKECWIN